MPAVQLSGLLVKPLVERLSDWIESGKLDEHVLDAALTPDARSLLEPSDVGMAWIPLADVESIVDVVAGQLGGEPGLVEWAPEIVERWLEEEPVRAIGARARGLVDAAGFVVAQASEQLVRQPDWRYRGGRLAFRAELRGLPTASASLKALIGALLSRLVERTAEGFDDVRVDGVDAEHLAVFGERDEPGSDSGSARSRLHRAALVA